MGEVTARANPKLQRDVAIKVLPEAFAARSRSPGAVRARGAGGRGAGSIAASSPSTTSGARRRRDLRGDGAARRRDAAHRLDACRCPRGGPSRSRRRSRGGSRRRTAGHRSSRYQAGERVRHGDGRVKVLDFGLARLDPGSARRPPLSTATGSNRGRGGDRHGRLHVARAGPRPPSTTAPTSFPSAS